ncbi:MAG TPA: site-2 protease family protein [Lacipirellulaceae bacterium]|nr:site-2 protease family protein [Lacipirellulaceae bacterium]
MSTPSPSDPPHSPEQLPALPSREADQPDGKAIQRANDKAANIPVHAGPRSRTRVVRDGADWVSEAELREPVMRLPRRRVVLPLVLFVATCLSTFWVGAANWRPEFITNVNSVMAMVAAHWQTGLTYMFAVLAILLTHEMGHFLLTVHYRIPASYPLCIPVPFSIIGTMGAVISMDGMRANRKQIFDIGIAGPLAGLVVAVPILYIGVRNLDLSHAAAAGEIQLYNPVIIRKMIEWVHPQWADRAAWISVSQLNPYFMAGWVGMLITGLNMLPVSQLDGGHTIYGLFGRDAYKIARAFTIIAIAYVVINLEEAAIWTPMLILVILLGIHHPPTADDSVELDDFRWILGVASMAIPILCFPLQALKQ